MKTHLDQCLHLYTTYLRDIDEDLALYYLNMTCHVSSAKWSTISLSIEYKKMVDVSQPLFGGFSFGGADSF
jgi:hypothetical protein